AQVAAHRTREPKRDLKPGELFERNMELASKYGVDPGRILAEAMQSRKSLRYSYRSAQEAVSYAIARNFEREAVADDRALVADALIRGLGDVGVREVRTALDSRYQSKELLELGSNVPRSRLTTEKMLEMERSNLAFIQAGRNAVQALARQPVMRSLDPETQDIA